MQMRYYKDRWTGAICSQLQLHRMIERNEVQRFQLPRRFRALPESCCRLLDEAELVAAVADRDPGSRFRVAMASHADPSATGGQT